MNALSAARLPSASSPSSAARKFTVRYINTSAHQRSELRAKLNQAAVDLLGAGAPSRSADSRFAESRAHDQLTPRLC